MKKILIWLLVIISSVYAEKLTILNDIEQSSVYLNGVLIGEGAVAGIDIEPGEYNVSVKANNQTIFNKKVYVYSGENKVVNTNKFIDVAPSNVANIGAKKREERRLKQSTKGKIGVGVKVGGYASGLSGKYLFNDELSIQLIGWSSNAYDSFQGRLLYELGSNLVAKDQVIFLYTGLGLGNTKGDVWLSNNNDKNEFYELFLGVEYPNNYGYTFVFEASFINNDATDDGNSTNSKGFVVIAGHHFILTKPQKFEGS